MKKVKTKKKKYKIIITCIMLSLLLSFILLQAISKQINTILLRYATSETKRFANVVANYSIDNSVLKRIDNEIFTITKSDTGEIQMLDFNTVKVNNVLEYISHKIQTNLIKLEEGNIKDMKYIANTFKGVSLKKLKQGVVCEIPTGVIFGNSILASTGPVIPVRLSFMGEVLTNITTNIKSYGINNAYIQVGIHVRVTERITMPTFTKELPVDINVPLTVKVIQGKVPTYYQSGYNSNSSIYSLPIEK